MRFQIVKQLQRAFSAVKQRGVDVLRDPRNNKGMGFTFKERQALNIHGMLPPHVCNIQQEAHRCMTNLRNMDCELNQHLYLSSILDRNEKLFYKMIIDNVDDCLPLVYTPTVGKVCQEFGQVFSRPRGMYITIHDKDHIKEILQNWPEEIIKAIVVTDGERILGLGDLGAQGMGIPIGKMSLYTALAGVPPQYNLPITLDVGTDNENYINDPTYIGLKQKRVRGEKYLEFVDAFMEAVAEIYGGETLIQFEDFANQNAFNLLERYRNKYCTFNDDIQGTASVTLSALLGAENLSKRPLADNVFLFQGAGSAGSGIAMLLKQALVSTGLSEEEALSKIFMFDIDGLLTYDRKPESFTNQNVHFAKNMKNIRCLEEVVAKIKPTVLVGVAGVPGVFTKSILQNVATNVDMPYIFALSNPTSQTECTAEDAYKYTNYKALFASGSPFKPVNHEGRVYTPSQCNNSYIFPGVALGITMFKIRNITDEIFIKAAETLAHEISSEDISSGTIFPPLSKIRDVSLKIACAIGDYAYANGSAHLLPEPEHKERYLRDHWFEPEYESSIPNIYYYPQSY